MRKTILVAAFALAQTGCIWQALAHANDPDDRSDELDRRCHAVGNDTIDNVLCGYMGRATGKTELAPPDEVVHAGELLRMEHDHEHDTPYRYDYAADIAVDALDRTLASSVRDREIGKAFLLDVKGFKQQLADEIAAASPGWRAVFVEPAAAARAEWSAGSARRAPWLAKARALIERADRAAIAHGKDAALEAEMIALHRAYVDDCRLASVAIEECLGDEVARPLTTRLVQVAWDANDAEGAAAARAMLDVPDVSRVTFAVRRASAVAAAKAKAERDEWEKAKNDGRSESAMRTRWPSEPPEVGDSAELAGDEPPEPALGDHAWPGTSRALVASVSRKGSRAVIAFVHDVEMQGGQDCHETNKVDSIDDSGNIHYREICNDTAAERVDLTEDPINVPADETAALRAGEVVTFVCDDHRRGHVIEVHSPDKRLKGTLMSDDDVETPRVQLGAYRLSATPTAKAAKGPRR